MKLLASRRFGHQASADPRMRAAASYQAPSEAEVGPSWPVRQRWRSVRSRAGRRWAEVNSSVPPGPFFGERGTRSGQGGYRRGVAEARMASALLIQVARWASRNRSWVTVSRGRCVAAFRKAAAKVRAWPVL